MPACAGQGAVIGADADAALMADMGLQVKQPDSGCCGMAGSFGYESGERYEVSIACGERVILPAVRAAEQHTIVLADGFSCRGQIDQGTDRQALHLAEVLALARRRGPNGPPIGAPERYCRATPPRSDRLLTALSAATALGGLATVGGLVAAWAARRARR